MMTSSKIRQNMENMDMGITFDLRIVEKWLTTHFICIASAQRENDVWAPNLANFLMTSSVFRR